MIMKEMIVCVLLLLLVWEKLMYYCEIMCVYCVCVLINISNESNNSNDIINVVIMWK